MYACKMRDLDSVKLILERKANPNAVTVVCALACKSTIIMHTER